MGRAARGDAGPEGEAGLSSFGMSASPSGPSSSIMPGGDTHVWVIYGLPAPQGSRRHVGHGVTVESSKAVRPWRQDIRQTILDDLPAGVPWVGPVRVAVSFTFPRPKGHFRTGRNAGLLRDAAPRWPAGHRNDLDKLVRAVFDAVTSAGVWGDDGQVVELEAVKVYVGDWAGLDRPGALVEIARLAA